MSSLPDSDDGQISREMEYVFLMQDIRGYIRVFSAEQLLHDFNNLFPAEYQQLVAAVRSKEIKDFNEKKKAYLLTPKDAD